MQKLLPLCNRIMLNNISLITERMMAAFIYAIERPNVRLKSMPMVNSCISLSSNIPWGKTGQITHFPSPSRDVAQKTRYPHHASEATCQLGMGALALKHCVQLPYSRFTLQLSTAHQFSDTAHTPVSSAVF